MNRLKASPSLGLKVGFVALASLVAFFFGLIAITANPILIGLALGLILGVFFLAQPKASIWIVLILGLGMPAVLDMLGHGLSRVSWGVAMLSLLLWVPGLFHLLKLQPNQDKSVPYFVWAMLGFTVMALLSTALQLHSIGELLGGFKRYFQTYGLALALCTLPFVLKDYQQWLKALLIVALFQLPFALFERFILVPLRGGMEAGGEVTDVVAGTMGANLQGGSPNSVMVTLLLIAVGFIGMRFKEGLLERKWTIAMLIPLLLPLLLGETKVVVIMIPLMACVLLRHDILKQPMRYIPILVLIGLFTALLAYIYVYLILDSDFVEAWYGLIKYNLQDEGYGTLFLNRTTAMLFWWKMHGAYDPLSFLFGHGLGSSYGSGMDAGHIAVHYPLYGINLTTISSLLWDVGLLGLVLYFSIYGVLWLELNRVIRSATSPMFRADAYALQTALAFTVFFTWYSDSQVNLLVHEIILAFVLGYAGFLISRTRQDRSSKTTADNHAG